MMALDWLKRRNVAATPPQPAHPRLPYPALPCPRCDRALQHPALDDLMFQRQDLGGRGFLL